MHRLLPLSLVLAFATSVQADEPDTIRAELLKAKQNFTDTTTKAKATLLTTIDDVIKTVAAAGDLDGVKAIQNERKVFDETGKTPTSAKLGTAVGEYTRATKQARTVLDKAYDQAVKEYTKALKIESAEAVRKEWKEIQSPAVVVKDPDKKGEIAPKAKWIPGNWTIVYCPSKAVRKYSIKADGTVVSLDDNSKGQLKEVGGAYILDFGDQTPAAERLTFAGSRLFVEHFNPKGTLEKNDPVLIGIGELTKKK